MKLIEVDSMDIHEFGWVLMNSDYLESKKILHRDLACRNILIHEDKSRFTIKISGNLNYSGFYHALC